MKIICSDISKKFGKDWIFKNLQYEFSPNRFYCITGANGSGKSTLLLSLSGYEPLYNGKIDYHIDDKTIDADTFYRYFSICSPQLELIEELSIIELVQFHHSLKKISLSPFDFVQKINLDHAKDKPIAQLSSGMRQRVKLGLALCSNVPVVFLDEPTMNLDKNAKKWFHELFMESKKDKLIIMASNEPEEYKEADTVLSMENFK